VTGPRDPTLARKTIRQSWNRNDTYKHLRTSSSRPRHRPEIRSRRWPGPWGRRRRGSGAGVSRSSDA
jgi:hypothetical protein